VSGNREAAWTPSKAWGQNYLVNKGVIEKIVDAAGNPPGHVVEIGPGRGALTQELLERGFRVTGIELHRETAVALRERFAGEENFTLLEADASEIDYAPLLGGPKDVVLGNLPYCVAARILYQLFRTGQGFSRWVLMFQREVAQRIAASCGSRDYGQLSVVSQLVSAPEILFHVQPGSFSPPPEVISTVMVFHPRGRELPWDDFSAWLTRIFSMRRKQMGRILSTLLPGRDVKNVASVCGFDLKDRPERLSPEEHLHLFHEIFHDNLSH